MSKEKTPPICLVFYGFLAALAIFSVIGYTDQLGLLDPILDFIHFPK